MSINNFAKKFLTMLTGNTISQVIPFFAASLLTRIFLPEEFGLFSHVLAISTMCGIVSCGRLELAIPLPKEDEKAKEILFLSVIFTISITILSFVIYFFIDHLSLFYKNNQLKTYLFYVPFLVLGIGTSNFSTNWILRNRNYKSISIIKIVQAIINNFGALLLGIYGFGVNGLILSWLGSMFLPIVYLLTIEKIDLNFSRIKKENLINTFKDYKDFPMFNSLHSFIDIFATQVVLFWLISYYFGEQNLGLFTQMNKYVKAPIILITSSLSQVFYVEVNKAILSQENLIPYFNKTLKSALLFAIPFCIIIYFFGEKGFSFFLGKKFIDYAEAGKMAVALMPMLFSMFIVSPLSVIPNIVNKQRRAFVLGLFFHCISLLVIIILIKLNKTFLTTLLYYSISTVILYAVLVVWYYKLLKINNT